MLLPEHAKDNRLHLLLGRRHQNEAPGGLAAGYGSKSLKPTKRWRVQYVSRVKQRRFSVKSHGLDNTVAAVSSGLRKSPAAA